MKSVLIIKYVFSIVGLVMLIGAYSIYNHTQNFLSTATISKGTVTELIRSYSSDSVTYAPTVRFKTQNGQSIEFTSSSSSNPPSYSRGETVEVLYQPDAPNRAKINGFFDLWGGAIILAGLGLVFFIIGFSLFAFSYLKNKRIGHLKRNGSPVWATFQSVELNHSYKVNGKSPYQIHAQWKNPSTSELHIFTSDNIWFDPSQYINDKELTVLIDKKSPKNYFMDISFLPTLAK